MTEKENLVWEIFACLPPHQRVDVGTVAVRGGVYGKTSEK